MWTDVARMRTLNMQQTQTGHDNHLCPMQEDIAVRVIEQFSMEGETVFDPFVGIGTVAMHAVKMGRKGMGTELSEVYFSDAVRYMKAAESGLKTPSLFDILDEPEDDEIHTVGEIGPTDEQREAFGI